MGGRLSAPRSGVWSPEAIVRSTSPATISDLDRESLPRGCSGSPLRRSSASSSSGAKPDQPIDMELDLIGGQSHGYVRRKVAQANGRAGEGAAGEEGTMSTMLNQVADGVWVRQSAWVWSNAMAVRGEGGLVLVDPGIDGSELN